MLEKLLRWIITSSLHVATKSQMLENNKNHIEREKETILIHK